MLITFGDWGEKEENVFPHGASLLCALDRNFILACANHKYYRYWALLSGGHELPIQALSRTNISSNFYFPSFYPSEDWSSFFEFQQPEKGDPFACFSSPSSSSPSVQQESSPGFTVHIGPSFVPAKLSSYIPHIALPSLMDWLLLETLFLIFSLSTVWQWLCNHLSSFS